MPVAASPPEREVAEQHLPAKRKPSASWIPLLIAAVLLPFANGGHSLVLAAWLAPIFLLRFTRTRRLIVAIPLTFLLQAITFAIQFRGMIPFPAPVQAAVIVIYSLVFTAPYIGDRLLGRRLSAFPRSFVFPLVWAAIEFAISFGPFASWCSIAYSQFGNLPLLQLLSITGLYGITFLIAWTAAAANAVWEEEAMPRRAPPVATACGLVLAIVFLLGGGRLALLPVTATTVRVASISEKDIVLHPDPGVVSRFNRHEPLNANEIDTIREHAAAIADDLIMRSEREARSGARIIFWGEGNALVLKADENELIRRGASLAKSYGIYLGMSLATWHLETTPHLENKIVLLRPDGTFAWEFFKAHPVPGREAAISIISDGKMRVEETPFGRLSTVVCFDADFPRFLAQAAALRCDIVLDASNDWKAIDPLHTQMASFRAIEQGFNLVRHTSHGLSAAYDYEGRQLARMDHFATEDRVLIAHVPASGTRTVYSVLGDWFGWSCIGMLSILLVKNRSFSRPWSL